MSELDASAADIRMIGGDQFETRSVEDLGPGLLDHLTVNGHLAGENHGACALARWHQTTVHQQRIQTRFPVSHEAHVHQRMPSSTWLSASGFWLQQYPAFSLCSGRFRLFTPSGTTTPR
jgi:hypothetical protein